MIKGSYQADPNMPESKKSQAVLEYLVDSSFLMINTLGSGGNFYSELFIHNVKDQTGFGNFEELKKIISGIDKKWNSVACIDLRDQKIIFKFL